MEILARHDARGTLHGLFHNQAPEAFRKDVRCSRGLVQGLRSQEVSGFHRLVSPPTIKLGPWNFPVTGSAYWSLVGRDPTGLADHDAGLDLPGADQIVQRRLE